MKSNVAICIPNFNMADTISLTIESALKQTYNVDIIISDNASSDRSWEIINQYAKENSNIKVFRNKETTDFEYTFTTLLGYSQEYEYINILAADDTLEPSFIEKCMSLYAINKDLSYVYTHRNDVINDKKVELKPFFESSAIIKSEEIFSINMKGYSKTIGQVLLNNSFLKKINAFDVRFRSFTEINTILQLNLLSDVGYINEALFNYRKNPSSETEKIIRYKLAPNYIYMCKHDILTKYINNNYDIDLLNIQFKYFMVKYCIQFIPSMLENKEYNLAQEYLFMAVSYKTDFYNSKLFTYLYNIIHKKEEVQFELYSNLKQDYFEYEKEFKGAPYPLPNNSILIKDV